MDEIRERESCVSERERERERERRGGGRWESSREEREKTIKKLNTHATVPM